jgi:hypothetical protein
VGGSGSGGSCGQWLWFAQGVVARERTAATAAVMRESSLQQQLLLAGVCC